MCSKKKYFEIFYFKYPIKAIEVHVPEILWFWKFTKGGQKKFFNTFFHHSLAKTFLFKYFQENFRILNFHHKIHEKHRKFINKTLPLR